MTSPLRRLHRAVWLVLPLLLVAALVVALAARRPQHGSTSGTSAKSQPDARSNTNATSTPGDSR